MTAAHYSSRADRIAPVHLSDRVGLSSPAPSRAVHRPDVDMGSLTWMVRERRLGGGALLLRLLSDRCVNGPHMGSANKVWRDAARPRPHGARGPSSMEIACPSWLASRTSPEHKCLRVILVNCKCSWTSAGYSSM